MAQSAEPRSSDLVLQFSFEAATGRLSADPTASKAHASETWDTAVDPSGTGRLHHGRRSVSTAGRSSDASLALDNVLDLSFAADAGQQARLPSQSGPGPGLGGGRPPGVPGFSQAQLCAANQAREEQPAPWATRGGGPGPVAEAASPSDTGSDEPVRMRPRVLARCDQVSGRYRRREFLPDETALVEALTHASMGTAPIDELAPPAAPVGGKLVVEVKPPTGSHGIADPDLNAAVLGLLSRVGSKSDDAGRRLLSETVVLRSAGHSLDAPLPTDQAGPRPPGLMTAPSLTSHTSDSAAKALVHSAVHNPLFGILESAGDEDREANVSEQRRDAEETETVMLSDLCHLHAASEVAVRPLPKTAEDEMVVPERLWGLSSAHPIRRPMIALSSSSPFDWFMTAAIIASCIAMAMEHPRIVPGSAMSQFLRTTDIVLTVIFLIEVLVKIITFGLKLTWSKTSNKVDILIALFGLFFLAFENSSLSFVKSLRALRAVRALRVATRSDTLQQLINSMVFSVSSVLNVTFLLMICVVIFAILGVQLFSGLFFKCNDKSVSGVEECVGTYFDEAGDEVDRRWFNSFYTFDSLPEALVSLFVVSTLSGYATIMNDAISAPAVKGLQPQPENNPYNGLFFVAFVVVAVFVMLNLYVGAPCKSP